MKILVLGAGLVGSPMALDLASEKKFQVTVADINSAALERLKEKAPLHIKVADLCSADLVRELAEQHDLLVSAVPGFMGYATLQTLIKSGKPIVDIAFFPEDPFTLDEAARQSGQPVIVDCGVAPGMSHVLASHAVLQMDKAEEIVIYVGGLPQVREWPYEYKAVFSPIDVIEEYTRPARYVEHGHLVTRPALSDPELLTFSGIGTLEAFNTDGLRSLLRTLQVPNMKEKTLRYPGHIQKMALLRETGFFSTNKIEVKGSMIRPIDVTAQLLFPKWKLTEGEIDITVMQVKVRGEKKGQPICYCYDLLDYGDPHSGIHSMARTTGYTATSAVRMIAAGLYHVPGISAPEFVARQPGCVQFLLKELAARGVVYRETIS